MSDSIRAQIYETLNLKETEELLSIWTANNRTEYTDQAFEIIQEILGQRLEEIPLQNEPGAYEVNDRIDVLEQTPGQPASGANAPAFFNPDDVMKISTWLKRLSIVQIPVNIVVAFANFAYSHQIINSFWLSNPNPPNTLIVTLIYIAIISGFQCFVTFFALRSLAFLLEILMEMEFNSRKA